MENPEGKTKITRLMLLFILLIVGLSINIYQASAQNNGSTSGRALPKMRGMTNETRRAAAQATAKHRAEAAKITGQDAAISSAPLTGASAMPMPGGTPNYFGPESNWANSPLPTVDQVTGAITGGIRKFVDSLPGLGYTNRNNLGQYIPVAIPDITTFTGCDYYEIELGQYTETMHSDLMPTTLL
jgi:hypothetical protein